MESIDKLRDLAADINSAEIIDHLDVKGTFVFHSEWLDSWHRAFDAVCYGIEDEIAERYMELPTDADGKPIHLGDGIRISGNETVAAEFVGWDAVAFHRDNGLAWEFTDDVRNVQNRTVEDVLREFGAEFDDYDDVWLNEKVAEYADEIRRLL